MPTNKEIQQRLTALGYDTNGIDGILGRNSIAAITRFQKDKGLPIKFPGTIGPKTLAALGFTEPIKQGAIIPPWVQEGMRKLGLHETLNNKELQAYLKSDGQTLGDPAKLPWCGDFIETTIALTLPREPMVVNPYWARNWLKFGVEIPKTRPVMGCIGVVERGPTSGHVFYVIGHDANYLHALGGNQSNSISIVKIEKKRLLGLRFPKTYPLPAEVLPYSTFKGKLSLNEA